MNTKTLPFISLFIVATLVLMPLISAIPGVGGGSIGGGLPGTGSGAVGGGAPGTPGGSVGGGMPGIPGGSIGGGSGSSGSTSPGGIGTGGIPIIPGTPPSIPGIPPGPTPTPPGQLPIPVPVPGNVDAVWNNLPDVKVKQGAPDGTVIQTNVFSQCTDADDSQLVFGIGKDPRHFDVAYVHDDVILFNLDNNFVGTEKVTLTCNGVPESFKVSVLSIGVGPHKGTPQDALDNDAYNVHLSSIRLSDFPTGVVPVYVTFKNDGRKELENLKLTVSISDLNIKKTEGPMDIRAGKKDTFTLLLELPEDVQPGLYPVRITVDASHTHRVMYRDILIE